MTNVAYQTSHGIDWWVGSNGNLFGDHAGFRYCIMKKNDGYRIARNGVEIARSNSLAEAKLFISRD